MQRVCPSCPEKHVRWSCPFVTPLFIDDASKRHYKMPVRWRDLRHTCGSSLVGGWGHRWSMTEVRDMLDHRSITTTQRYAHLSERALDSKDADHPGGDRSALA
jgi:site-specific recombinase XerD